MITTPRISRSRGFTLVEALVALLALSIGLLGIAGMQITGMRANLTAGWRSQATYLGYDIMDRMRANRTNRLSYVTSTGPVTAGATVASQDLAAWKANLAATLPAGDGTVVVDDTLVTITVQWNEDRDAGVPAIIFTMRSRI
jgi:type IV pilus assembly protein PilV